MPRPRASEGSARAGAAVTALGAASAAALVWGFTVDDALIPARYAHHLASGQGYVFNPGGPSTDGVTPLGFAHLLAPFASARAEDALFAARCIGLVAWLGGAGALGSRIGALGGSRWRWLAALVIIVSAPLAAWSSAGLETGLVAGIAALALALRHAARVEPLGSILLGLAAGLRPELLPFALVAGVPAAGASGSRSLVPTALHAGRFALVLAPFAAAALTRSFVFGRAAPLAAVAKQSTFAAGATYAAACFVLAGPFALLAPWAWRALSRYASWLVAAVFVHLAAVALAGGDWMPLSRLVVPAIPAVVLVAAEILATPTAADRSSWRDWASRAVVSAAIGLEIFVWTGPGLRSRRVMSDRLATIDQTRAVLSNAAVIGTLDVGWVGAAAPRAKLVDFAGVTDPLVAVLPGGHTSKPIPDELLASRDVDTLVLLLADGAPLEAEWTRSQFARGVERWVALSPGIGERMVPALVTTGRLRYVVLRRR